MPGRRPKPAAPGRKLKQIDLPQRLNRVERMLAERVPRQEMLARLQKDWGIGERQVKKYLTAVYARRRQEIAERRPFEIEEVEMTFERILSGAIADKDWGAARLIFVDFLRWRGYPMGRNGIIPDQDSPPVERAPGIEHKTQILINELTVQLQGLAPREKKGRMQELVERRRKWIESGGDPNKLAVKAEETG